MAASIKSDTVDSCVPKPELVSKINVGRDAICQAILIKQEDGVITITDDRAIRIWLKRDTGQYWPSVDSTLPSEPSCMEFNEETRRLFIGLSTGTVLEFSVADDFNHITPKRQFPAHQGRLTAVMFSIHCEWVLTCGRDKYFHWSCSESGQRLGGHQADAWCTCLEFDERSRYVFVGDYGGKISVLKISDNSCEVITILKAHSGSIRALAWDDERKWLFSASFDQSVIIWDIGGQEGTAYELQGHLDKVETLCYSKHTDWLISAGEDRNLVFWDIAANRKEVPEWAASDICQKCEAPFFWNVRAMWERKLVGLRQHHCRACGKALCDNCCSNRRVLPQMGFELAVRVCDTCVEALTDADRKSLAQVHESKHSIVSMDLDSDKRLLLTAGKDRIIKIWNLSQVLKVRRHR